MLDHYYLIIINKFYYSNQVIQKHFIIIITLQFINYSSNLNLYSIDLFIKQAKKKAKLN